MLAIDILRIGAKLLTIGSEIAGCGTAMSAISCQQLQTRNVDEIVDNLTPTGATSNVACDYNVWTYTKGAFDDA